MPASDFHDKPFDEGTLTKLQIFELYAREWLPVFLSHTKPIHVFDFFSGPGVDSSGQAGSPIRVLNQIKTYKETGVLGKTPVYVHFFDKDQSKIGKLESNIDQRSLRLPCEGFDIRPLAFAKAFPLCTEELSNSHSAKLVYIDQCGVDHVTPDVFRKLVSFPTCDFLFFLSSSTLHRFRNHPAIKQKIVRPDDPYHVHRAAFDYYRHCLPEQSQYYLAPFSIKKGSNIYGVIFGSGHPLGMDKFLQVAWKSNEVNGEADFDINRENILPDELLLPFTEFRPSKITAFERELEKMLREGRLKSELDIIRSCFEHGVKRQHAEPILVKLKKEGVIDLGFRVPDVGRWKNPRPIRTG